TRENELTLSRFSPIQRGAGLWEHSGNGYFPLVKGLVRNNKTVSTLGWTIRQQGDRGSVDVPYVSDGGVQRLVLVSEVVLTPRMEPERSTRSLKVRIEDALPNPEFSVKGVGVIQRINVLWLPHDIYIALSSRPGK